MTEKRFLLDFEVEAHACLKKGLEIVSSVHPAGDYELEIENLKVEPGIDRPLLSLRLIVPAGNIEKAKEVGEGMLNDYLHLLTFTSGNAFNRHKLVRIVDWTIGLKERPAIQYEEYPGHNLPYAILNEEHFRTIERLQTADVSDALKRSLKWFANGVRERYSDDQFQYFWFVVELVSQLGKDTEKVNDLCPKCSEPLYCETCGTHPTHRPYQKQSIKQLFQKFVSDDQGGEFFEICDKIRNRLMHGDPVDGIEKSEGIELSEVVDNLGKVAWTALLSAFGTAFEELPAKGELEFAVKSKYTHTTLILETKMTLFSSDPDNPVLAELAKPTISAKFKDGEETPD